jgi:hypothetical protein
MDKTNVKAAFFIEIVAAPAISQMNGSVERSLFIK